MIFVIFCYLSAKSVRRGGCSISHKTFLILQIEECKINYTQNPYIYVYINRVYVRGFKRNARPWNVYHVFGNEKRPFHGISNDQIQRANECEEERKTEREGVRNDKELRFSLCYPIDSLISANVLADKSKFSVRYSHYNGHKQHTLTHHAFPNSNISN